MTAAWVESPLQLLGALEHAHATGDELAVVPRSGDAQLERTAAHLADRRAFGTGDAHIALDRRVMPARLFRAGGDWLIGDAYSGQVQWRLERAEPQTVTLVDDGAITRRLAQQLQAAEPLLRPNPPRAGSALRRELAARTTRLLRRLAREGRLRVTTFLAPSDPAVVALRDLGAIITCHRFDATRQKGLRAQQVPDGARIVLGSAAVADRLVDPQREIGRLRALARESAIAYLPHRREPQWFLAALQREPEMLVVPAALPIELALAGTPRALHIIAPISTAAETLPVVLRGTGSIVLLQPPVPERAR